jgi:hypothetical protein
MLSAHKKSPRYVESRWQPLATKRFRVGGLPSAAEREEMHASPSVESPLTDEQMLKMLQSLSVRLNSSHPRASPAMIQDSIDEAIRCFRDARVQQFLPILIERSAWEALRTASTPVGR